MALRRARTIPSGFSNELRNFIRRGEVQSAMLYVTRYDIPVGRIIKAGLQKLHRGHARVQQAMEEQGRTEAVMLEKRMGVLATMAGVAPLLGFLGTVVGIALAFDQIAQLGGKVSPDALADGISQALYTTVFGLIVGIPAFAAFNYLQSIIQETVANLEATAREILDTIEEELPSTAVGAVNLGENAS
jgi:biopolymer transport protein ExbB